jgi:surfeit locus 1 family protein
MTIAFPTHEIAVGQGTERPRRFLRLMVLGIVAALSIGSLSGLGVWQMHRLSWKVDLIERVNQRVHAVPVPAPGPADWPRINAADDAYRHVSVRGRFVDRCAALVRAVTERGGGYWVMAPFETADGFRVFVNRGFVPADDGRDACRLSPPRGETSLTGLLRISEPGGGFLRANDPGHDRWYSRDVAAIAASRHIDAIAPYFIDAGASADPAALPVGGLTVIAFPNNHLVYALTWFGLAIMAAGWSFYAARLEWLDREREARSGDGLSTRAD